MCDLIKEIIINNSITYIDGYSYNDNKYSDDFAISIFISIWKTWL